MNDVLVSHLSEIGPWALAAMAAIVFAETGLMVGFFLPGDSMLFSAGVLIASGAVRLDLVLAILVIAGAAFLGDQVGYTIGARLGPKALNRPGSRLMSPRHIARSQSFFAKHGPKAVILARFVPVARTFTPVVAGVGSMPRTKFAGYNAVGALAWSAGMIVAGAMLGGIPFVANHIELVTMGLVGLSISPVVATALKARRTRRSADPAEDDIREPAAAAGGTDA